MKESFRFCNEETLAKLAMQNQHRSLAMPPLAMCGALQADRLIELLRIS